MAGQRPLAVVTHTVREATKAADCAKCTGNAPGEARPELNCQKRVGDSDHDSDGRLVNTGEHHVNTVHAVGHQHLTRPLPQHAYCRPTNVVSWLASTSISSADLLQSNVILSTVESSHMLHTMYDYDYRTVM